MPKVGPPGDSRDEFAADLPLQRRVACEHDFRGRVGGSSGVFRAEAAYGIRQMEPLGGRLDQAGEDQIPDDDQGDACDAHLKLGLFANTVVRPNSKPVTRQPLRWPASEL